MPGVRASELGGIDRKLFCRVARLGTHKEEETVRTNNQKRGEFEGVRMGTEQEKCQWRVRAGFRRMGTSSHGRADSGCQVVGAAPDHDVRKKKKRCEKRRKGSVYVIDGTQ